MTGVGKSKLINLLLEEMKSIEGGSGFSTTSKKILVYQKHGFPIRFYDVKGIENEETLNNYQKIITDFNIKNNISNDSLNTIFYCVEYKENGKIFLQLEYKLFENLIKFDIPILFIITKTDHDPSQKSKNKKLEINRQTYRNRIENAINDLIKVSFKKNNRENEAQKYIEKYIKISFVNLVRIEKENPIPVFGIDKVLSDFSEMVPKEEWDKLELACKNKEEKKCKELLKNNLFLRYYSEFENLNKRNKEQAKGYLKRLKTGAFFSGMLPGLDIGMEYFYKYLFKKRLKALYDFDYDQVKKALNETNIINQAITQDKDLEDAKNDDEENNCINNSKDGDNNISMDIEEQNKIVKHTGSIIRGLAEVGEIILKDLPAGFSAGLKLSSWILLPISCIGFGAWSTIKVNNECKIILTKFEKASPILIFETLYAYVSSIRGAISHLKILGQQIIKDDQNENQ